MLNIWNMENGIVKSLKFDFTEMDIAKLSLMLTESVNITVDEDMLIIKNVDLKNDLDTVNDNILKAISSYIIDNNTGKISSLDENKKIYVNRRERFKVLSDNYDEFTTNDYAKLMGISFDMAGNDISFLNRNKMISDTGKKMSMGGKGKSYKVYKVIKNEENIEKFNDVNNK